MAYTPELSQKHSSTLRRIAWALEMPMTVAIEMVFEYVGKVIDKAKVCEACRDKSKCTYCVFNRNQPTNLHSGVPSARLLDFFAFVKYLTKKGDS